MTSEQHKGNVLTFFMSRHYMESCLSCVSLLLLQVLLHLENV